MEFTYLDYIKNIETNIFTVVYNYVKAIVVGLNQPIEIN